MTHSDGRHRSCCIHRRYIYPQCESGAELLHELVVSCPHPPKSLNMTLQRAPSLNPKGWWCWHPVRGSHGKAHPFSRCWQLNHHLCVSPRSQETLSNPYISSGRPKRSGWISDRQVAAFVDGWTLAKSLTSWGKGSFSPWFTRFGQVYTPFGGFCSPDFQPSTVSKVRL